MTCTTEVASISLPRQMLSRLRNLAHRRSLAEGKEIRWTTLVRDVIETELLQGPQESSHFPDGLTNSGEHK